MTEQIINIPEYTDENIKTLEWNEHIRKRAGMYIGNLGGGANPGDGIYVLLKEIVDNSVDEFSSGYGKTINIEIDGKTVSVRDFGRGIPLDSVVKATSNLNTGGKFDSKAFKKSVGLNGVGTKAVNALSEYFYIESFRNGESSFAEYSKGNLTGSGKKATKEKNGTLVGTWPIPNCSGTSVQSGIRRDSAEELFISEERAYAYPEREGLQFKERSSRPCQREHVRRAAVSPPIHLEGEDIEVVLTHSNSYGENISSFVNGQNTRDGGTHLAALREAIVKTLKEFYKKDYAPEDIRQGIVGAISIAYMSLIRVPDQNQAGLDIHVGGIRKDAEGNTVIDRGPTIRSYVNDFIKTNLDNYLHIHKETAAAIQEKIIASEQERKEISGIQKKKTRTGAGKASVYNKKLRDCSIHYNDKLPASKADLAEKTSIFITEGDSASGTITKVRYANTQAVFSLRGKPVNCYKVSRKKVAENEELNLLINALGVEEDMADLRYNNIIVATDADDDGIL